MSFTTYNADGTISNLYTVGDVQMDENRLWSTTIVPPIGQNSGDTVGQGGV